MSPTSFTSEGEAHSLERRIDVLEIAHRRLQIGVSVFLAVVLDAFSRRVAGWSMANHLKTKLVSDALEMAQVQRDGSGVIHHSDSENTGSGCFLAA